MVAGSRGLAVPIRIGVRDLRDDVLVHERVAQRLRPLQRDRLRDEVPDDLDVLDDGVLHPVAVEVLAVPGKSKSESEFP